MPLFQNGTDSQQHITGSFPDFPYQKSFIRIHELLNSEPSVRALLGQLEANINAGTSKEKAQQLYDALRLREVAGGFDPSEVGYWLGVVSADDFFKTMLGTDDNGNLPIAFLDPLVQERHGAETHRIQWWMVSKDLEENPGKYDDVTPAELFRSTASEAAQPQGIDNLWFRTFDAQAGCDTARSPESLMGNGEGYIQARFSRIYDAELNQRAWISCVKTTVAKAEGVSRIKMMAINNEMVPGKRNENVEVRIVAAVPK